MMSGVDDLNFPFVLNAILNKRFPKPRKGWGLDSYLTLSGNRRRPLEFCSFIFYGLAYMGCEFRINTPIPLPYSYLSNAYGKHINSRVSSYRVTGFFVIFLYLRNIKPEKTRRIL